MQVQTFIHRLLVAVSVACLVACASSRQSAQRAPLPFWIKQSNDPNVVTCSHISLDAEESKIIAENKCLVSAIKSKGVNLRLKSKTVESLTGADSGEVASIEELHKNVECSWTRKYLEELSDGGFRTWLQCTIRSVSADGTATAAAAQPKPESSGRELASLPYAKATLQIITVPRADKCSIIGSRGERVVEITSNVFPTEIREGDQRVECRKQRYHPSSTEIPEFRNGDVESVMINLEQEI